MTKNCGDYLTGDYVRKIQKQESNPGQINVLLSDLLEKKEEISLYKERLKELESAFYYNLEIISERDLELSVLEKRLSNETSQLQKLIEEKNDLEDIVKTVEEKNNRKIQQLESELSFKDEEIKELERENENTTSNLKRLLNDAKQQQQKQIQKIANKFEAEKIELKKRCVAEIEERKKYYQHQVDNLSGRLEEAVKKNEKLSEIEGENKTLKCQILEMEKLFLEKENFYLHELSKFNSSSKKKISKETQCEANTEGEERSTQTSTNTNTIFTQTTAQQQPTDTEENYLKKIKFLQDQNEVLKCVVKDMKKNLNESKEKMETCAGQKEGKPDNSYSTIKAEVEQIREKYDFEIKNLKKMLLEEQKQRAEEESIIQSLETSVTCLKDKLLSGIQENLQQISGDEDICSYTYNRELQNEIKVSLLEEKLLKKMDSFTTMAEQERQKVNEKLEQLKTECLVQVEKLLQEKREPEVKSESLVEKIREEIQKLESKIESDMKNIVRDYSETSKCDKNKESRVRFTDQKPIVRTSPRPGFEDVSKLKYPPKVYYHNNNNNNDVSMERCVSVVKLGKFHKEFQGKKFAVPNELIMASF